MDLFLARAPLSQLIMPPRCWEWPAIELGQASEADCREGGGAEHLEGGWAWAGPGASPSQPT